MSKLTLSFTLLMSLGLQTLPAFSAEQWLIASQTEQMDFAQHLAFDMVKPADVRLWPEALTIKLVSADNSEEIELIATPLAESAVSRRYVGIARKPHVGIVRATLATLSSNRLLVLAATTPNITLPAETATTNTTPSNTMPAETVHAETAQPGTKQVTDNQDKLEPVDVEQTPNSGAKVMIASPAIEPTISTNEPIYFVVGNNGKIGNDARFQISFKYRPFDPESSVATFMPVFSKLYFAYTQTTVWDLGTDSGPFRDTSYRPSLFYQWAGSGDNYMPSQWRVGAEHESNGQSGQESRSLNTVFVQPSWNFDLANGKRFTFFPRIYQYVDKGENPYIQQYRGYVDWKMRYGREDGLIFSALFRHGTGGYSAAQLDLSHVISDRIFGRTGSFVQLQLLSGYGETLLDFNKKNDTQLRIGLSIAR